MSPAAQSAEPWPLPFPGGRASGVTTRVGLASAAPGALGAATSPPTDAQEEEEEEEKGEERRLPRSSWYGTVARTGCSNRLAPLTTDDDDDDDGMVGDPVLLLARC